MISNNQPKTGGLLISEPFMIDPNFKRSVVLLTEHGEEGTVGYVLNQKSNLLLKDVLNECPDAVFPVYYGGPVASDTLHYIHKRNDLIHSGIEIKKDIFWGGNFETIKILINSNQLADDEIRFFMGYSGWGHDQLKNEIRENSWITGDKFNSDIVFVANEEDLWKEVIISLGPKYAHIVNFPENPMWN
ncbi:YqgE/AlgH family protein [Pedobacter sp. HMF7647]|uniref:YqgE/AlgH family protein n=1 Tax=Hufsiella arboris TaxID=2695275 RepID=A0A7K1YAQ7_9SPHI|nr:YqgE/AlgH family protein [Hufsiella arboris]MXV51189.1 YqgE/AlgH family protein [Hufsiella arboris]